MEKMSLDSVTAIKNITDENEVNEFLAKGYRIIKVLSMKTNAEGIEEVKPVFILGVCKEK